MSRMLRSPSALCLLLAVSLAPTPTHASRGPIALAVDLTEASRKILHAKLVIPAEPGELSLSYPKWIPGEHGPTGPLPDVAGLRISAAGAPLAWRRDPVDMYAVHCTVPAGARSVEVSFDFLAAAAPIGFSSAASVTEQLALLSWNQVLLYPTGEPSDGLTYEAKLRLPPGWKFGTALPVVGENAGAVDFAPVSLTTLVDSPVIAGAHFRRVPLTTGVTGAVYLDMACDGEDGLRMTADELAHHRRLVQEADALFGARHFREYHFLLSLSDHVAHFGLEHHESSDDRVFERTWLDDDLRVASSNLLAHEFVHSWNGKYRRPAGLATPDYQKPMQGELLWVYEGLTQYLGSVLAARSGIRTPREAQENLALQAATLDHRPGRTWRPLLDTAVEAQQLYGSADEWESWRRSTDFYNEGLLIWLEADVTIRRLTGGRRSLDDFCKRFHGPPSGPPKVVPYTFDDIVRTLGEIAPNDWRSFFTTRLESLSPRAPMGGIEGGGWKVVYTDSLPPFVKALEEQRKNVNESFSIGLTVNKDGVIADVIPDAPAGVAGVPPGAKLVAVNGRQWTKDVLRDAIRATRTSRTPLELLVVNGEFYRTCSLDYHGGARYPHLVRDAGRADVLSQILAPHAR